MATERLPMRTIREILRQKWQLGRSNRAVARSVGLSVGAIGGTLHRARAAGLATWDAVMALPDDALAARLYARGDGAARARPQPDCASIHTERRQPGVTLQLLHLEYLERHPDGYQYTPYCEVYRQWLRRRGLTMRQVHRAGEKSFVDYAGKRPSLTDPATGERIPVELLEDRTGTRATIVTSHSPAGEVARLPRRPHRRRRDLRPPPPPRPPPRAKGPVTEKGGQPRQLTTTPRR